ncbi:PREDICTED: succinate receptor 1 isoform X1 [Thamnophis sirtalis]|uniref:Succinate receptor 1 isoform X1 n=1 Tax=Thamnophis sirtalis TaxID=35019 RepID=A0A6I9XIR4_9SAUR|nr:PREDICTED: succinate receptor 1 isoform X1 [Thamnophis sirtalis]
MGTHTHICEPVGKDKNDTRECMKLPDHLEKYYLTTMYSLEFIFGFTVNVVVGLGSLFYWKTWKSSNIYLINLILSDLSFLCTLPWLVSSYSKGTEENIWCQFNRTILFFNLYTSILFMTFISIDRYLLMKYPFKNHFLQKRATAIVFSVAIWIWIMLELCPIYYFITSKNNSNSSQCLDYASSGDAHYSLIYSLILTVTGYIIPLCIMWVFYIKTRALLVNHSLQFTTALSLEKPLVLIIMAVSIFSLLFSPYHIMRNVRIASRTWFWEPSKCTENLIKALYTITRPIAFLNSVINPFFYFLMGDQFRETLTINVRHFLKRVLPCYK